VYAAEFKGALPTMAPYTFAYTWQGGDIWWFAGYSQDNCVLADHLWYNWLQEGTNAGSPYNASPRMNGLGILLQPCYQYPVSRPDLWTYTGIRGSKHVIECPTRDVPNENNFLISYGYRFNAYDIPGSTKPGTPLFSVLAIRR
jgi:hypothetical protein